MQEQQEQQEQEQQWLQSCITIMKKHAAPLNPSSIKSLFALAPSAFLVKLTRCLRRPTTASPAALLCDSLCSTQRGALLCCRPFVAEALFSLGSSCADASCSRCVARCISAMSSSGRRGFDLCCSARATRCLVHIMTISSSIVHLASSAAAAAVDAAAAACSVAAATCDTVSHRDDIFATRAVRDALFQLCGCSSSSSSASLPPSLLLLLLPPALQLISNVTFANPRCCSIYCNSLTVRLLLQAHALFPSNTSVFSSIASIVHNMCDDAAAATRLFSCPQVRDALLAMLAACQDDNEARHSVMLAIESMIEHSRASAQLFAKSGCCRRALQEAIERDGDDKSAFRESAINVLSICRFDYSDCIQNWAVPKGRAASPPPSRPAPPSAPASAPLPRRKKQQQQHQQLQHQQQQHQQQHEQEEEENDKEAAALPQWSRKASTSGLFCCICLEALGGEGEGEAVEVVELKCPSAHAFHEACAVPWLKSVGTCPTCLFRFPV